MSLDRLPGWKWTDLIPANGYARCYGCHRPWWMLRKWHDVWYARGRGAIALCEPCWDSSTTDQRLVAYRWVFDQWRKSKGNAEVDELWQTCEANIRGVSS